MKRTARGVTLVERDTIDLASDDLTTITLRYETLTYTPDVRDTDAAAARASIGVAAGALVVAVALIALLVGYRPAMLALNRALTSSGSDTSAAFRALAGGADAVEGAQPAPALAIHPVDILRGAAITGGILLLSRYIHRRATARRLARARATLAARAPPPPPPPAS